MIFSLNKLPPLRSIAPFTASIATSSALLGPILDDYHSKFGVLQYDDPIYIGPIETAIWVPFMFSIAGIGIGYLYLFFDNLFLIDKNDDVNKIDDWPKTLTAISFFTFQYYASGFLSSTLPPTTLFFLLLAAALTQIKIFDASKTGIIVAVMLAIFGPSVECLLMTFLPVGESYHYTAVDTFGLFPAWIAPVYAAGGPAVGRLARGFWRVSTRKKSE